MTTNPMDNNSVYDEGTFFNDFLKILYDLLFLEANYLPLGVTPIEPEIHTSRKSFIEYFH